MSEGQPGGSAKERRAQKNRNYIAKIKTYGTRADRKAHAIATGKPRRPRRPQNVALTQHQRDINYISRHIADAQARYTKDPSDKNHQHLMMYTNKLAHVVQQDDAHPATHASTEHVKPRSGKKVEQRRRAEERRLEHAAHPLSKEQKMAKAAESKARRDAMGIVDRVKGQSNKDYKVQQAARRAAATVHGMSEYEPHPEDAALYDQANVNLQTRHRGVPSEYAI